MTDLFLLKARNVFYLCLFSGWKKTFWTKFVSVNGKTQGSGEWLVFKLFLIRLESYVWVIIDYWLGKSRESLIFMINGIQIQPICEYEDTSSAKLLNGVRHCLQTSWKFVLLIVWDFQSPDLRQRSQDIASVCHSRRQKFELLLPPRRQLEDEKTVSTSLDLSIKENPFWIVVFRFCHWSDLYIFFLTDDTHSPSHSDSG